MNNKNYNKNNNEKEQPVSVGEVIDVEISDVGDKGDGIAKVDGFVIFVKNAVKGQNVKIRIEKVLKSVAFGKLLEDLDMNEMRNKDYSDFEAKSNSSNKKSNKDKKEEKPIEELFDSDKDSEDF